MARLQSKPLAGPIIVIGLLWLVACGSPSGSGPASASPSTAPSAPSDVSFCNPLARLDLRTANGNPVVLSGFWAHAYTDYPTDIVTIALRQAGDCVWIVGTLAFPEDPGTVVAVREFHGRLDPSFKIIGEFSDVYGASHGNPWTYGRFVYRVEVSADRVKLVEDRDPSDPAPGCSSMPGTCPDPHEYIYVGPFPTF